MRKSFVVLVSLILIMIISTCIPFDSVEARLKLRHQYITIKVNSTFNLAVEIKL